MPSVFANAAEDREPVVAPQSGERGGLAGVKSVPWQPPPYPRVLKETRLLKENSDKERLSGTRRPPIVRSSKPPAFAGIGSTQSP